jgi:hypothetical protein
MTNYDKAENVGTRFLDGKKFETPNNYPIYLSVEDLAKMVIDEVNKKLNVNKSIWRYEHINARSTNQLKDYICGAILEGWELYGSMIQDGDGWVQPMVKYKPEDV